MSVTSRFLLLTALRWLPVGLIVPVVTLLPLDRGLSLAQVGAALATQGVVVLLLELPTGGLADAWGRRPVLLVSALVALASYAVVLAAHEPLVLAAAYVLMGVSRALDSGPLGAWFVDESGASSTEVASALGRAGAVVGVSIAAGSLLSGALVAWAPVGHGTALALPYAVAIGLVVVQVVVTSVLMVERRPHRGSARRSLLATGPTIVAAARLVARSRVLRALVAVEVLWGFGMVAFESYTPVRLAELLGGSGDAAAVMGPASAAAWGASALGAALVGPLVRRWSAVPVSVALRLVQGATVVAMGLVGGPAWLLAAFLATYAVHMAAGAVYETLLHAQADETNRATVLSLASMAMHPGGTLGALLLGVVAGAWSTGTAFVLAGLVTAAAAPLFLVRERGTRVPDGRDAKPWVPGPRSGHSGRLTREDHMAVATADRPATVPTGALGGGVVVLVALAAVALAVVNAGEPSPPYEVHRPFFWPDLVLAGLYAALGTLVVVRGPRPVGWALLVVGLGFAVAALAIQYAVLGERTTPPALGLVVHAMLWSWLAGALVALLVLPWLLVPGRWDAVRTAGCAVGGALVVAVTLVRAGQQVPGAPANPATTPDLARWAQSADPWCVGVAVAYGLVGAGVLAGRARSRPPWEHRALRWVATGLVAATAGYTMFEVGLGLGGLGLLGGVLLLALAHLVVGAAVLVLVVQDASPRLELALSRTVVGGLLTAGTVAAYVGVVALLVRLLPWDEGTVSVVAVALLASAVAPVHARVRDRVGRLVHGSSADPARLLADVHRALVAPHAAGTVLDDLVGALRKGLRMRAVTVRADDGSVRVGAGEADGGPALSLPLVSRGRRIGTLEVVAPRGERLDPRTTGLLERISGLVAVTLAQTMTTARLEALRGRVLDARQAERRQLRRELHDGLGPSLAGAGLALGAIANGTLLSAEHADLLQHVQRELARRAEDVRLIARAVLPPALDDGRLGEALRTLSRTFDETRLAVRVDAGDDADGLDPHRQVAVYHVAVEGVWNAFRHADATCCDVVLRRLPDGAAELVVRDDGRGMRPDAEPGLGLASMRERAHEAGGTLQVRSGADGTTVTAVLP